VIANEERDFKNVIFNKQNREKRPSTSIMYGTWLSRRERSYTIEDLLGE
jgi:hypothetical protein